MKTWRLWVGSLTVLLLGSFQVQAQTAIVRIEEDWELQVAVPDEQQDAPQITTSMLPFGGASDIMMQWDFNHGTAPDFSPGGMQVRLTNDGQTTLSRRLYSGVKLSRDSETVRWTQVVHDEGNQFFIGIVNGSSYTWGSFGGSGAFISVADAGNQTLNNYTPQDSIQNSSVTFASNRVSSLILRRIRLFNSLGQVSEIALDTQINQ
ncbi:MAG: hypothetical protein KDB03_07870 [Planctomycetales bacterium]|nr:hypothetical protein [Planctomycetales bacterium]